MKTIDLSATIRKEKGTGNARRMRNKSLIPAILYGGNNGGLHLTVAENEFLNIYSKLKRKNVFFNLKLEGNEKRTTVIKEIQLDSVSQKVLHIDFFELSENRKFKSKVPIDIEGLAEGVKAGGILEIFCLKLL